MSVYEDVYEYAYDMYMYMCVYTYIHRRKKNIYIYEGKGTDTWEVCLLKKRNFCSVWSISKTAALKSYLNMENIAGCSVNMWDTAEEPGQNW